MNKARVSAVALAFAAVAVWTVGVYAAETAAAPPATTEKAPAAAATAEKAPAPAAKPAETAKPAPEAKAAAKPKTEVKGEFAGKLASKTVKTKKGKEVKIFELKVAKATGADGKELADLKGKTVRVVAAKGVDVAKFVGKEATVKGTLVNNRRLVPETIK